MRLLKVFLLLSAIFNAPFLWASQAMVLPPDCKPCQAALAAGSANLLNGKGALTSKNSGRLQSPSPNTTPVGVGN